MRPSPSNFSHRRFSPAWGRLALLALWMSASTLPAQQLQEHRRLNDILKPRTDVPFRDTNRKTNSIKTFDAGAPARTKGFPLLGSFKAKDYRTSAYKQTNAWSGQTAYQTNTANLRARSSEERLAKGYDTKDYGVTNSRYLQKAMEKNGDSRTYADAGKSSNFRGKSQDKIDIHGPAAMATINSNGTFTEIKTMDDVRNLLNELSAPPSRRMPQKSR